ncbi:hypothetical protein JCM10450v2_004805 [Rhodotorula kratochvilovae]
MHPLFGPPDAPAYTAPTALPRRARSGTIAARPLIAATPHAPLPPPVELKGVSEGGPRGEYSGATTGGAADAQQDSLGGTNVHSEGELEDEAALPASPTVHRIVGHGTTVDTGAMARRGRGRGAATATGQAGGALKGRKKWLVLVVPPDVLPHDPPPAATSGFANGYGAQGRFSGGILVPLQPSLSAQVAIIAREYGTPSIAGMCLYLALSHDTSAPAPVYQPDTSAYPFPSPALSVTAASPTGFKPRLTDETWPTLWSEFFDEEGAAQAMQGAGGLPIAGRIEFDFDPRRARWLEEWRSLPPATSESFASAPPLSPAFSLRPDRPRFATSLPYVRPFTPATSDAHLSEMLTTDDEARSLASEALGDEHEGLSAPVTPRMSTPRTSFESHRPLSLISQSSSVFDRPQSRSASVASMGSAQAAVAAASKVEAPHQEATPTRPTGLPARLAKPAYNDSGFGEGTASPAAVRSLAAVPPPEPSPITLTSSGSTFAFPRPLPRSAPSDAPLPAPPKVPGAEPVLLAPESDWTTQLDRLREISETSLLDGVDHPSQFGSVDASASEALGELLLSIVNEAAPPTPPRYEEDFRSGMYPPHGLYGLDQPVIVVPPSPVIEPIEAGEADEPRGLVEHAALPSPIIDPPPSAAPSGSAVAITAHNVPTVSASSPSARSSYPFFSLYPPVYPHIELYPPLPASSPLATPPRTPPAPFEAALDEPSELLAAARAPLAPDQLVDDDPFASSFSPDSPASPATGTNDEADDFLESYLFDGRPLSSITEVTESDLTNGTSPRTCSGGGSGRTTPAERSEHDADTAFGGMFGELQLEEDDGAQWATQPVGLPEIALSTSTAPPYLVYSSPTGSIEPSTLDPSHLAGQHSPLPSPTITPASAFPHPPPVIAIPPLFPHDADNSDDTTTAHDEDYTLDVTETLSSTLDYSGTFDAPYIVSPGLQAALGLDDSPQLLPVQFDDDDLDAQLDSEDSQSDDGSQYSGPEGSLRLEREGERDPGDECQTFDHFVSMPVAPVLPVLFAFSPLRKSRDLLDALALFIVEAQVQSVERRGRFTVALGGGDLPALLAQALIADERIEWDKWEIFFAREALSDNTGFSQRFIAELFSRVPVCSGKVHVLKPGADEDVAQDYEEQLARVFKIEEEGETPRFDLVLLSAEDLDVVAPASSAAPFSPRWVAPLPATPAEPSTALVVTPLVLSSARRLAYLLPSPSSRPTLVSLLAASPPGHVQLASRQPVVLFADDDAAVEVEWERARFWDAEGEEEAAL